MGKSDLIDKINARVKSQMSSLASRTKPQARSEERETRPASRSEKRITNARTGKVVVRRRASRPKPSETAPVQAEAAVAQVAATTAEASEARVTTIRRRPKPTVAPQPEDRSPTPEAKDVSPQDVGPTKQPPPADEAQSSTEGESFEEKAEEASAKSEEAVPSKPTVETTPPAVAETAEPTAPAIESAPDTSPEAHERDEKATEAPVAAPVEPSSPPVGKEETQEAATQDHVPAAIQEPPSDEDQPPAPKPPSPASQSGARSIEDVLERELGPLVQQRKAIVVGEAPPKPKASTAGGSARTTGRRAKSGTPIKRATPQTPEEIKRVANEERKREKGVVKVANRGRPDRFEDKSVGRVLKPKKTSRRKAVYQRRELGGDGEPGFRRQRRVIARREKASTKLTTPKAIKRIIRIQKAITVGEIAHRMGVKAAEVIRKLMGLGVMANISQSLDADTAALIASEFGYEVENVAFDESTLLDQTPVDPEKCVPRPPVVTVMGHVDHGKTTLLDAIRHTDVARREAGGITQHIGAHTVDTGGGRIVFLDTPGHEAFTAMRARGAQATDIVVLVVAADDGVMPQTVEAINHAKAADVPIIVAINKIDKPGAEPDRIKQKLAEYDLVPEEWGGQTLFVNVSAKNGTGIDELLEVILLQAEVLELSADPSRRAQGIVIESKLDKGRGPVCTVIIKQGTLKRGDFVVVGSEYGKIRAMVDDRGRTIRAATPSTAVEVQGLSGVPNAGDRLDVAEDLEAAKKVAEHRREQLRKEQLAKSSKVTLEDLYAQMQQHEVMELKIVLKGDVQGSIEAIQKAIGDLSTDKVKTVILHAAVGTISEGDVSLASASNAIVLGFNVGVDAKASTLAEQEGVQINTYTVIYEAIDEIKKAMFGLLKPVMKERVLGHAEVRETFNIPKFGLIAGSSVVDGKINRGCMARVLRDGEALWEGKLVSLKRFKEDVREVEKGYECGIALDSFNDIRLGDVIEAFTLEETQPTL